MGDIPLNQPDHWAPSAADEAQLLALILDETDSFDLGGETAAEVLARLEGTGPHWWVLAELTAIAPASLDQEEALNYLRIIVAHEAWLHSLATRALAAAAGPVAVSSRVLGEGQHEPIMIDDVMREEVAAALRLAPSTAHQRICDARTLMTHLPRTLQALDQGRITALQARAVTDAVQQVAPARVHDFADHLEQRVLPRAMRGTLGEVRSAVRSATRRLDPEGVNERAREARRGLDVQVWHDHGGVSTLSARLLTEHAVAVAAAIDGAAQAAASSADPDAETTPIGQRRSEALVAFVLRPEGDVAEAEGQPAAPAQRASLNAGVVLVMDLPTWLGLRDDPVAVLGGTELPAEVARELAADATFRRAIVDPESGRLIDYGRRSYEAPEPLRRFLLMRDQQCRFPGCRRGSEKCEADHVEPWNSGGSTSAANMGMVCKRHHQLKTHADWHIDQTNPDGSCVWVSPQGRRYLVDPPVLIEPDDPAPPPD